MTITVAFLGGLLIGGAIVAVVQMVLNLPVQRCRAALEEVLRQVGHIEGQLAARVEIDRVEGRRVPIEMTNDLQKLEFYRAAYLKYKEKLAAVQQELHDARLRLEGVVNGNGGDGGQ